MEGPKFVEGCSRRDSGDSRAAVATDEGSVQCLEPVPLVIVEVQAVASCG